jgi:DNA polymerase-3 subunit gamma/tau
MVIVRLAHASDLPTPDEAVRVLKEGGGAPSRAAAPASGAPAENGGGRMAAPRAGGALSAPAPAPVAAPRAAPTARVESFADIVALAGQHRELRLKHDLETYVRPVRFEPGRIEVALTEHASPALAGELSKKLEDWTGARWMISVVRDGGGATIAETRQKAQAQLVDDARADPLVAAVLETFPGAEIVDVRVRGEVPGAPLPAEAPVATDDEADDDDV